MSKVRFCERLLYLDKRPIRFDGRPYLRHIYNSRRNLVLRCSRQTEKSTFLANTIIYEACTSPGIKILFVCPRDAQARFFSRSRLLRVIDESALVRRELLGQSRAKLPVMNLELANGSQVFLRAAYHTADAARGISADLLMVDEFQDIAAGHLPILQETLSHSRDARTILTGTPKLIENHLETMFAQSTAHEWRVACPRCGGDVILDERVLGPTGPICPIADCRTPLDPSTGRWVARNPDATWGDGFWVNHVMVPWVPYADILQRQTTYDAVQFRNEVIGLPATLGDHVVTRAELEACCDARPMAQSRDDVRLPARDRLLAGIDWGAGGAARTVVAIGAMNSEYTFELFFLEAFAGREDPKEVLDQVAARCEAFAVRGIAADGGGSGHLYNRLLVDRLNRQPKRLHAVHYSQGSSALVQDGVLWKWTVPRSSTIGALFGRIKKQTIRFPRVTDCDQFLNEFACEIVKYDDEQRTIRYTHPENAQDDALHATNYAVMLGVLGHRRHH